MGLFTNIKTISLSMKAKVVLFMGLIVAGFITCAQKYQFEYQEKEQKEVESVFTKKHFLGEDIAFKMQLLRENYIYKATDAINNTESTYIEKSSIYNSVNKVSKHLKKRVKSGHISREEAAKTMGSVLKVAINIRYQDTESLEKELWSLKDPTVLTNLFTEGIALN